MASHRPGGSAFFAIGGADAPEAPSLTCSGRSPAGPDHVPTGGLRLDLHNHTAFSRDGTLPPNRLLTLAAARGLTHLAVTDHDRLEGALACARLAREDPSLPRVIVGEEMASQQGDLVGLFLTQPIPGGLSVWDTLELIRLQGGVAYLPHPFDSFRKATMAPEAVEQVAALCDVVEVLNCRALVPAANTLAERLAVRHETLLGAGSDAHFAGEVGRAYLELPASVPQPHESAQSFLEALRRGRPRRLRRLPALARSWYFCLGTGGLMALRRRAGLQSGCGG